MRFANSWLARVAGVGLQAAVAILPCVAQASEDDPWEPFNRTVFKFNETLDRYLLKPVAKGYQKVLPQPVQTGVHNFFNNLGEFGNLANDLLQAKFQAAGADTSRLLLNSSYGVLGLFDVATSMGVQRNDEDFGQTLGVWGVKSGPYLVLPFFGPSTVRDGIGRVPDYYTSVYPYIDSSSTAWGLTALDVVDTRANLLSSERMISGDKYVFLRNAYLQNREFKIKDGKVQDDF